MEANQKLVVEVRAEVLQAVRQHARSSMSAEVCGVLIGSSDGRVTAVEARIPGEGAAQGGAHVTFTQATWEHIYKIKDQQFPKETIVGWYHSHPGFGVFLSEYDLFIHRNFFSNPGQIAWVYDPHSDEEGCFIWVGGEIARVVQLSVKDKRGAGGGAQQPISGAQPAPLVAAAAAAVAGDRRGPKRWVGRGLVAVGLVLAFLLGFAAGAYLKRRQSVGGVSQPLLPGVPKGDGVAMKNGSNGAVFPGKRGVPAAAVPADTNRAGTSNAAPSGGGQKTNTVARGAGGGKKP
jgi:proteasome lid subunit RPN8/RPN11